MSNLKVEIDSIDKVKKDILLKLNDIIDEYDYLLTMVDSSKNIFDTNTGEYLREKIIENINEQKVYINNEFSPFINRLDDVKVSYTDLYNDIKKEVS